MAWLTLISGERLTDGDICSSTPNLNYYFRNGFAVQENRYACCCGTDFSGYSIGYSVVTRCSFWLWIVVGYTWFLGLSWDNFSVILGWVGDWYWKDTWNLAWVPSDIFEFSACSVYSWVCVYDACFSQLRLAGCFGLRWRNDGNFRSNEG